MPAETHRPDLSDAAALSRLHEALPGRVDEAPALLAACTTDARATARPAPRWPAMATVADRLQSAREG